MISERQKVPCYSVIYLGSYYPAALSAYRRLHRVHAGEVLLVECSSAYRHRYLAMRAAT